MAFARLGIVSPANTRFSRDIGQNRGVGWLGLFRPSFHREVLVML